MCVLATVGLTACGAPAYTYVADSSAQTYYKVPSEWHQISQQEIDAALKANGESSSSGWFTAFDAGPSPTVADDGSVELEKPFVFAEVGQLSSVASNELSYNAMRDLWLPVTSDSRSVGQSEGFGGTNFTQLRDQTISAKLGVHGVRETFQYTFEGVTDTFDEEVLTNADQTMLYTIQVHCVDSCYTQNQNSINTIMSSFTVGSPT
jgi:hypothetical protein